MHSSSSLVGRWSVHRPSGELHWDPAFSASLGLAPDHIKTIGDFLELVHPDDRGRVQAEALVALTARRPYAMRYRLVTPDGQTHELLAWGELHVVDGEVESVSGGLVEVGADPSELTRLQEDRDRLEVAVAEVAEQHALVAKSERRFRLVFENAPIGMVMFGPDGRFFAVNRVFAEIVGRTADDLIGEEVTSLAHERHRADSKEKLALLKSGDVDSMSVEREIVRPDGSSRWTSVRNVVERSPDGSIEYFVAMVEDITERRNYAAALERQALRDPVTGLPNRSCLRDRLGHDLEAAARSDTPVGLLFCDLDRFKSINDRYGHAIADEVLVAVASRLTSTVRAEDTVARYAGDEFVVVCRRGDASSLTEVAARISRLFHVPVRTSGGPVDCGVSIGVAVADRGQTVDELLDEADEAMFEAKRLGRSRVEFFDDALESRRRTRVRVQSGLRTALREGNLEVHYQPQISLETGSVDGVEALLRWRHPTRGLVEAKDFIAVADEVGLLHELSLEALRQACRQGAMWGAGLDGGLVPYVAVNIAATQVGRADLPATVALALSESGMQPAGLRLEVTEEALIDDLDDAAAVLDALADLGVESGIDDFGTGYASLAHLHALPVRFLKLDGTFVRALEDPSRSSLVSSVVDLGRSLDLRVVAECVETDCQVEMLQELGVDAGQGHVWAPALSGTDFEEWLAKRSRHPAASSR